MRNVTNGIPTECGAHTWCARGWRPRRPSAWLLADNPVEVSRVRITDAGRVALERR
jgi:hypothetical protein